MVTLWDLLMLLSATVPLAGGVQAAKSGNAGFAGYLFGALVGVAVGYCNFRILWKVRDMTYLRARNIDNPKHWSIRVLPALYGAAFLWTVFGVVLSGWSTSLVLRYLSTQPYL